MTEPGNWESYFWPGTTVLRNKLGLHSQDELRNAEYPRTVKRTVEILSGQVDLGDTNDPARLRRIHEHLFGDIYDWAGQYRTVDMGKTDNTLGIQCVFAATSDIDTQVQRATDRMNSVDWSTLDLDSVASEAAHVYADLNYAHPFREGNGRATKLFLQQHAADRGWSIQYGDIDRDVWNSRSAMTMPDRGATRTYPDELVPVFRAITTPLPPTRPITPPSEPSDKEHPAHKAARLARRDHPHPPHHNKKPSTKTRNHDPRPHQPDAKEQRDDYGR